LESVLKTWERIFGARVRSHVAVNRANVGGGGTGARAKKGRVFSGKCQSWDLPGLRSRREKKKQGHKRRCSGGKKFCVSGGGLICSTRGINKERNKERKKKGKTSTCKNKKQDKNRRKGENTDGTGVLPTRCKTGNLDRTRKGLTPESEGRVARELLVGTL